MNRQNNNQQLKRKTNKFSWNQFSWFCYAI